MKIIVCVKQVPDTNEIRIDPVTGTLIRDGVPSILNPDDKNALEEALVLKDKNPESHVTVVTMGPPQAKEVLLECLAMGADRAILVSDKAFAGADTWATSETLAGTIKKLNGFDIVFCGRQAIDGDTAQVGPQIAERLNVPQVTYVESLVELGNDLIVKRKLEDGYEMIKLAKPALLTAIKELNEPRYPSVAGIVSACSEKEIEVWSVNDIDVDLTQIGLKGSPTKVKKSFTPEVKGKGVMLKGTPQEVSEQLVGNLKSKHLI